MAETANNRKTGITRLLEIAGAKKGLLVLSCILAVLSTLASFIPFMCIYFIIQELLKHGADLTRINRGLVIGYGWWAMLGMVASFLLLYASTICSHIAAFKILYLLKLAFTKHLASLPLGFHTANSTGKLRKMLDENIEKIEGFLAHQLPDLAGAMTAPLVMVIILLAFDWRMGLACLVPLMAAFFIQIKAFSGEKAKEMMETFQNHLEDMNNSAVEYVRGISVVKVFNQTVFSFRRFYDSIMAYKDIALRYTFSWKNSWVAFVVILNAIAVFLIPVGIFLGGQSNNYQAFALSFLFYLIFSAALPGPIMKLMYVSSAGRQISSGVARLDKIFAEQPLPLPLYPQITAGNDILFEGVSFSYTLGETKVEALKNISFQARQGEVTALVGASGSGKSTIAHLIPRFWDVREGAVKLGGVDVRAMDPDYLLNKVGFVFQDLFLFKQSILDNICIGKPEATATEIIAAARAAQCHEFINKLPDKYGTVIGTQGVHLSGGEQQRIVIARAILKNAPVIVLDEATAFADPENEQLIQLALKELIKDKTVIIIAHRLSTIQNADRILVMDEGRLIQQGTHRQLLAEDGKYRRLWDTYTQTLSWSIRGEGGVA